MKNQKPNGRTCDAPSNKKFELTLITNLTDFNKPNQSDVVSLMEWFIGECHAPNADSKQIIEEFSIKASELRRLS